MIKRWRADASSVLGEVLERIFRDREALVQGRVFVNRTRAHDAAMLLPDGALVEVGEAAAPAEQLVLLHVEPEFVVAHKPAGLVSVPDQNGHESLQAQVAAYCKLPLERVHPTSRLDRGVSGVVVFALAKSARDAFAEARTQGTYRRLYLALAEHAPTPREGTWNAPIGKDARDPRKRAVRGKDPADATTSYEVIAVAREGCLLALRPHTGRTHQLRVHAAHAGAPLDGDGTYGGRTRLVAPDGDIRSLSRVALHATWVEVPWKGQALRFHAPVPPELRQDWAAVGGDENAWAKPTLSR